MCVNTCSQSCTKPRASQAESSRTASQGVGEYKKAAFRNHHRHFIITLLYLFPANKKHMKRAAGRKEIEQLPLVLLGLKYLSVYSGWDDFISFTASCSTEGQKKKKVFLLSTDAGFIHKMFFFFKYNDAAQSLKFTFHVSQVLFLVL